MAKADFRPGAKLKILLITFHDVWGSLDGNSPLAKFIIGAANAGHKLLYISNDKVSDPINEIYGPPLNFFHEQIEVVRFRIWSDAKIWPFARRFPIIRSLYKRIQEIIFILSAIIVSLFRARQFDPDIIYGYEIFGVIAGKVVSVFLKKPFVARFQGSLLYPLLLQAQKSLIGRLNLIRYYTHILALKCQADLIVMTNDGTRGKWVARKLGNYSPIAFWFNGTDFLAEDKKSPFNCIQMDGETFKLGNTENSRLVVSVSRLVAWKRVDRIIRAMPYVISRVPNVHYIVVGDGPERSSLEGLARLLNIEKNISFAGNIAHSSVRSILAKADVFISMFDLSNVGNPLIEALALGKPIVTYDVGDTKEIIENGVNGIMTKSDKPDVVGDAIASILLDKELARKLSIGAFEYARKTFWSWQQRIDTEIRLLERLASGEKLYL